MSEVIKQNKRMVEQDIAKGIAILIVVAVHSVQFSTVFRTWLVATTGYAMPFFYFMSGYNYKPGRGTWKQNILKRIKQILLPLLYYSIGIYLFMALYFFIKNEANINQIITGFISLWLGRPLATWVGIQQDFNNPFSFLLGQSWFLQYMITGYMIFYLVADYALENTKRFISINSLLLIITCIFVHFSITLPWGLHAAPMVASLMLFGAFFGKNKLLHKGTIETKWNVINTICAFAIYLTLGLLYPAAGQFAAGMLGHDIGFWDVFMTLISAILGSYILVNISKLIEKIPVVNKSLEWCGANSLAILFLHTAFIRIFSDLIKFERAPYNQIIEHTDMKSVLVYVLSIIVTSIVIILINFIKKQTQKRKG